MSETAELAGFRIGHATDTVLKSGVTVITAPAPFVCGVHVMGGAPGTRETDLLSPDRLVQQVDAIVLAGGSAFGLDAASGVADEMRAAGRGFAVGDQVVPIVPAAILFDLLNGGKKTWQVNPYAALGRDALNAADGSPAEGSVGAGAGATTATLKGGVGIATEHLPDGVVVTAIIAVNAVGNVTVGDGPHFWAAPFARGEECGRQGVAPSFPDTPPTLKGGPRNTTIGAVLTNARLTQAEATRLAVAAHDGIARAVVPAHTLHDGDLIFAASTGRLPSADPVLLGHAAAVSVSRAIMRGVYLATPAKDDPYPTWQDRFGAENTGKSHMVEPGTR